MFKRLREPREPVAVRTLSIAESIKINRRPSEVWEFISSAESQYLVDDTVVSAVFMPGLPPGAGSVQATLHRTAEGLHACLSHVLEYDAPRRAVYEDITHKPTLPIGTDRIEVTVDPEGDGTLLTHTKHLEAAPGYVFYRDVATDVDAQIRTHWRQINDRIRDVLENRVLEPITDVGRVS